jgi:DNA-binding transcriptional regulator LsrR (DeoR family)
MSQAMIARRLGLSQASISRLLTRAKREQYLEMKPKCTLPDDRVRELEQLIYGDRLEERLRRESGALMEVRVFDSGAVEADETPDQYNERLRGFGERAAPYFVEEIFPFTDTLGVTWGVTLLKLIQGIQHLYPRVPRRGGEVGIIPLCGDPPNVRWNVRQSSSNLVAEFEALLNGQGDQGHSFTGVVASIPKKYEAHADVLRDFIGDLSGYAEALGPDGLIQKVDTILTGVGSEVAAHNPWLEESARDAGLKISQLEALTVGNLGGVFLPRPGLSAGDAKVLEGINERWMGVTIGHITRCAREAREEGRPGVVVLAGGRKAEVVLECVRHHLVNRLVIDQDLAAHLHEVLNLVAAA